jgi:hypothetical protein
VSRTKLFCFFLLLSSKSALAAAVPPTVEVEGDSQAGSATVSWAAPEGAGTPLFQVEVATSSAFDSAHTIYQGKHTQTVTSGLRDGSVYYRARYQNGDGFSEWSPPAKFVVEHPSLGMAFLLFAIGALVFVSTAFVIVRGAREVKDG